MKRFLFLSLLLITSLCLRGADATIEQSGQCGSNITYKLMSDGTLYLDGTGKMYNYQGQNTSYGDMSPWIRGKVKNVVISEGITSIGEYAFYKCTELLSVSIPQSVTSIGDRGFANCNKLPAIYLPDGLTTMGQGCFQECWNLSSIVIPYGVTKIDYQSFYNCTNLSSIDIPDCVTSISREAFAGCSNITKIHIPNSVTSIREYCFDGCSSLSFVELSSNLTNLPEHLFQNCNSLETIIIGEKVTSIGAYAFDGCTGVKSIYCKALMPPSFGSTFNNEIKQNATLYVPNRNSSYAHYAAHDKWGTIQNIQEIDMLLLDEYISDTSLPVLPMVELNDDTPFSNQSSSMVQNLSYIRTFNNVNWQALYVPFKMNYEDWCNDFEVAKINNFHQFDTDDNGEFDNLQMEVIKVKSGTLKANHPYLIKAKSPGEKVIELLDTRLYACLEKNCVCNSMETTYTFTGTYAGVSGEEMYNEKYYSMGGGSLILAEDATANLKPYRWYLKMEGRDGQVIPTPSSVRVMVWDGETCSIETLSFDNASTPLYSVDGRMVENSKAKGLYIINGKKVLR